MNLSAFFTAVVSLAAVPLAAPPATSRAKVSDSFFGVRVSEDYRWLEDAKNSEVRAWSDAQNAHARNVLDQLPNVDAIRKRVTEILAARTVSYDGVFHQNGTFFAIKRQPPKQQSFLIVTKSWSDTSTEHVLVDPNVLDSTGSTSIDWYVPSRDAKFTAVSLSRGGTESGDVHIYETATAKEVYEVIPRVNGGTAGGDIAWSPDGTGFWYTRYPRGDERPARDMDFYQQVYYHKLGTPTESDRYEIGRDFPRIAEIQLDMDPATGRVLATVQDGDGGEFAHHLRMADGTWRQFSGFGDRTVQAIFGTSNDLFALTRKNAPRGKIVRLTIPTLDVNLGKTVVPEGKDTIVSSFMGAPSILATETRLFVEYQLGGPSEIRVFDHDGKSMSAPKVLPVSSVFGLARLSGDSILFGNSSYVAPSARYWFSAETGRMQKTAFVSESVVNLDDAKVVREFATSKDGTQVPVNIIMPEAVQLDGSAPCVVTGYGGYGVSLSPGFRATTRIYLDQGVIYAIANLRGGGEYLFTPGLTQRLRRGRLAGAMRPLLRVNGSVDRGSGAFGDSAARRDESPGGDATPPRSPPGSERLCSRHLLRDPG